MFVPAGGGPRNRVVPYAENPIYNNLAREAMPVNALAGIYAPAGALPNLTPSGDQQAQAYVAPPDPDVISGVAANQANVPVDSTAMGWVLG
jgi:hypothetical protein